MRGVLRFRRTFAAVLVGMVAVAAVIGALRDDDEAAGDTPPAPAISVSPGSPPADSPSGSPSGGPSPGGPGTDTGPAYPTAVAPSPVRTDPDSGLPVVDLADLPAEARETVGLIDAGGPFPFSGDGETFLNSGGLLPARETGYYSVYTVDTPGPAEPTTRVVAGADGELYWTDDLYESFRRIER